MKARGFLSLQLMLIAGAVVLAIAGWWRLTAYHDNRGYQRAKAEGRAAAETQAAQNRDLQRAAELRYTVKAETRDRFITKTLTEVRYVTQHLVSCPLGVPAVRVLNDAAACAREDRPASCGAGEPVRSPS